MKKSFNMHRKYKNISNNEFKQYWNWSIYISLKNNTNKYVNVNISVNINVSINISVNVNIQYVYKLYI